ncbi:MAG: hypothetical protein HY773_00595 [Candidatus Terrybacteria bacterium]|nr:hypothetical protein [Candidatus Terrybacteria bacterium]
MPWENIGKFLERFSSFKPTKGFVQDEAAMAIEKVLNLKISPDDIEWRTGVVYIKIKNSSLKNEIFLNKEKILEILKERVGTKAPKDLRF